jgi:hypothetical protein
VPIPPGAGPDAIRACSDQYEIEQLPGMVLSATEAKTGVVSCTFAARFGQTVSSHAIQLKGDFQASNVTYLFTRGRLTTIRFKASVDARPELVAGYDRAYGPPRRTVRAVLATASGPVRGLVQTWRAPGAIITLRDPVAPETLILVQIARRRSPA